MVLTGDTSETVWYSLPARAQPITFDCSILSNATSSSLQVWFQAEVASTVEVKAGSYYIKTP